MPTPLDPLDPLDHPPVSKLLRAFRPGSHKAANDAHKADRNAVVRHLLACQSCCQLATSKLKSESESKPYDPAYISNSSRTLSAALQLDSRLRSERADVPRLWSALLPLSPAGRKLRLENSTKYHTWGMFTFLLESSRAAIHDDARLALSLADLALSTARLLSQSIYQPAMVREAEAEALIERANALRVIETFPAAFRSLRDAQSIIDRDDGPQDLLTGARLASIRASLRRDVGDFEGAISDISSACRVYVRTNETIIYGRALLTRAYILRWIDPEQGYATARQALQYIPRNDHMNRVIARHTCCDNLTEAGRYREAWMQYKPAWISAQNRFASNPRIALSYRWLAARIDKGIATTFDTGSTDAEDFYTIAELTLLGVLESYCERPDSMQEAALVALDLVEIYMLTDRFELAIQAANDAYTILKAQRLPAFTMQSYAALQQAIERRSVDQIMVQSARESLARYWRVGKGKIDSTINQS